MKKGTLVMVEFLDHCQATNRLGESYKPAPCKVVGWVYDDNPTYLSVSAWVSETLNSDESDYLTIVKHKGMIVTPLKAVRGKRAVSVAI